MNSNEDLNDTASRWRRPWDFALRAVTEQRLGSLWIPLTGVVATCVGLWVALDAMSDREDQRVVAAAHKTDELAQAAQRHLDAARRILGLDHVIGVEETLTRDLTRIADAENQVELAESLAGKTSQTYVYRSLIARAKGQLHAAQLAAGEAVELDATNAGAHAALGMAWFGQKDYAKAEESALEALHCDSNDIVALGLLSVVYYYYTGNTDGSLEISIRLIEARPGLSPLYANYAATLRQVGRLNEAVNQAKEAIRIGPDRASGYFQLAATQKRIARETSDTRTAESLRTDSLANYDRAIELNGEYLPPHTGRGTLLFSMGKFDEALISLEMASKLV